MQKLYISFRFYHMFHKQLFSLNWYEIVLQTLKNIMPSRITIKLFRWKIEIEIIVLQIYKNN